MRLLVVDDEPRICRALRDFFVKEGFEVFTAGDGLAALQIIKEERPDLVLLDIVIPGMDGMEVLEKTRAIDPSVRIIMVTAVSDEPLAKKALALGAKDYITKPIDLNYLKMRVLMDVVAVSEVNGMTRIEGIAPSHSALQRTLREDSGG